MKKISTIIYSTLLFPVASFAYNAPDVDIIEGSNSLKTIMGNAIDWLIGLVGAAAVLFIIWGGFLYITAAGNKERAESAKKTLTYAVGGLIVVILARVIVTLTINIAEKLT